jgi:ABC-type Fe3+-siderophore transport system permease subunit
MALVLAFRLPYRRLRWSLALLCGGGLVSWLASILARSQPPTARPTTTGIAAVVGLGVVVFALLEWERRGNQTDGDGGAL